MKPSAILICVVALCCVATNAAKPPKICDPKQGWVVVDREEADLATLAMLNNDASIEGANVATKKGCAIKSTKLQKVCTQPPIPGAQEIFQYEAKAQMKCPGKKPGHTKTENVKFTRNYPRPPVAPAPLTG